MLKEKTNNAPPQFYRNLIDIISNENIEVDEGALWKLDPENNILILVDEDQYITSKLNSYFIND